MHTPSLPIKFKPLRSTPSVLKKLKKTNLILDVTYFSTTNLGRYMSKFVVLEYVTSGTMLGCFFYRMEGVFNKRNRM